ncbi:hypothetical protein PAXRUDRAFT_15393 [Paxillus rubicundulus Ve08.2h10]|uniref:Uncharacterized protein n=1 Tax=Paxillus rubicundulus Ve08.2h10 TaxID=930991 RepID=A0A0D0DAX4_9AGAM|nr:hypothetical protein PAXRUDRAFT_15393 [Paxillus rubicundulus Ve08.2h10]
MSSHQISKTAQDSKDINWARQDSLSDPHNVFENHIKNHKSLTKTKFLTVLASALKSSGKPPLHGHGICIGSTLKYLLRNVPFDIVKVKGHWTSGTFFIYPWRHAQILTPYMQAQPSLHELFLRLTLPPVR